MSASPPAPGDGLDRDQRLMLRIGEGDRDAFETLYETHGASLMRFLHGLGQDRALAEDLVQETFLRVWAAAPRWRPTGRVRTWLFQIAKRLFFSRHARRRMRREREAQVAERRHGAVSGPGPGPEAALVREDERARLERAIRSLSPKLATVFVLVRRVGLPYRETADVLGLRLGTVKSRMAAAEASLRRSLRGSMEEPEGPLRRP